MMLMLIMMMNKRKNCKKKEEKLYKSRRKVKRCTKVKIRRKVGQNKLRKLCEKLFERSGLEDTHKCAVQWKSFAGSKLSWQTNKQRFVTMFFLDFFSVISILRHTLWKVIDCNILPNSARTHKSIYWPWSKTLFCNLACLILVSVVCYACFIKWGFKVLPCDSSKAIF